MRDFRRIRINGKRYPIRCNIRVLGELQEVFGGVKQFEIALRGIVEKEKDGKKVAVREKEPSMKAVAIALPIMVNEGLLLSGEDMERLTEDEIMDGLSVSPYEAARIMEEEYGDCFKQKK